MCMTHIQDRRLEHFLAAVDAGSVLAATKRVHLSQPALSRSIRDLEASLGVPLLERHARGVRPTAYGAALARHARLMRNQARLALGELESLRLGTQGHLRIGLAPSFHRLLPAAITRLVAVFPDLTFEVIEGSFDSLADGVLAGDLEAAFSLFASHEPRAGLLLRPLIRSEFMLAMAPQHPLARRRRLELRDLRDASWVAIRRPSALIERLRATFIEAGLEPPERFLETDSVPFAKQLLRAGGFVGVMTRELVVDEVQAGQLVVQRLAVAMPAATAGVLMRVGAVLPTGVEHLVEAVESERKRLRLSAPT
jgi:DNA-binding transcriptional LysR family regulator